ncbi:MAG: YlbF family regulator [Lachnospiraceae bacterium]|nr:YlbF family regulator [Lachnospiraceae bacterium]
MNNDATEAARTEELSDLERCTRELTRAVNESPQMRRFRKISAKIALSPGKKEQIDQFRMKVFLLQNSSNAFDRTDEMRELFNVRECLHRDPDIREYLNSELDVCRMLQRICAGILQVADVEIDSFEDAINS